MPMQACFTFFAVLAAKMREQLRSAAWPCEGGIGRMVVPEVPLRLRAEEVLADVLMLVKLVGRGDVLLALMFLGQVPSEFRGNAECGVVAMARLAARSNSFARAKLGSDGWLAREWMLEHDEPVAKAITHGLIPGGVHESHQG